MKLKELKQFTILNPYLSGVSNSINQINFFELKVLEFML
jgi:hypothetical protein